MKLEDLVISKTYQHTNEHLNDLGEDREGYASMKFIYNRKEYEFYVFIYADDDDYVECWFEDEELEQLEKAQ